MTPDEYRRLIEDHANEIGRDPAEALGEFSDVLSQMTGARKDKLDKSLQKIEDLRQLKGLGEGPAIDADAEGLALEAGDRKSPED